jgi:hypothetical protein
MEKRDSGYEFQVCKAQVQAHLMDMETKQKNMGLGLPGSPGFIYLGLQKVEGDKANMLMTRCNLSIEETISMLIAFIISAMPREAIKHTQNALTEYLANEKHFHERMEKRELLHTPSNKRNH